MAKGMFSRLLGTGTRRRYKRTFTKYRRNTVLAQRPRQTYYSPLAHYFPLPISLKMRFTFQDFNEITVTVSQFTSGNIPLWLPYSCSVSSQVPAGTKWAGGLLPFLLQYSRCLVKKAVLKQRFMVASNSIGSTMNVVSAILPASDASSFVASADNLSRLGSLPQARKFMLSRGDGGHPYHVDCHSIDISKFLGQGVDIDYSLLRSPYEDAGATASVTVPSVLVASRLPAYVYCVENRDIDVTSYYNIQTDLDFEVDLSGLHRLSIYATDLTSKPITLIQRASS